MEDKSAAVLHIVSVSEDLLMHQSHSLELGHEVMLQQCPVPTNGTLKNWVKNLCLTPPYIYHLKTL